MSSIGRSRSQTISAPSTPNFPNPGPFLSDDEAKQLHQLVAHLTYRRFREFDTTWNTFHLLSRAYDRFEPFLDYIRDAEFVGQINIEASINVMKKRYKTWLSEMAALEMKRGA
jgi:hypothetical protein